MTPRRTFDIDDLRRMNDPFAPFVLLAQAEAATACIWGFVTSGDPACGIVALAFGALLLVACRRNTLPEAA